MAKVGVTVVSDPAIAVASFNSIATAGVRMSADIEGAATKAGAAMTGLVGRLRALSAEYTAQAAAATAGSDEQVAAAALAGDAQMRLQAILARTTALQDAQAASAARQGAASVAAFATLGRGLSTYVTAPTLLVGVAATKMAVDYQRAMLLIETQAGASASEVRNATGALLNMAHVVPDSPTTLAGGLFNLESIGLRGAKALDVLKTSALGAYMGVADLETMTSALGGAVVSGIKGAQDYNHALGLLNATVGAGKMHMQDLLDAMGTGLLSKAANVGVSLQEVGAALAVLVDRGQPAEQAATRLGTTFALMADPSLAAQKALAQMGISAGQLADDLRKPDGLLLALQTLQAGMQSVGTIRGEQDIMSAFGRSRQSGAILTLIQSLTSNLSSYQGKFAEIGRNANQVSNDIALTQQTNAYKIAVAWSSIESDLTRLGGDFAPVAVTAADAITKIADAFSALPGPIKGEVGIIVGLLAVGGPLLLAGAGVAKMVTTIKTAFIELPTAVAPALATTTAEVTTLQGELDTASLSAETLGTRVAALSDLGAIAIPITLVVTASGPFASFLQWAGGGLSRAASVLSGPGGGGNTATGGAIPSLTSLANWTPAQLEAVAALHGPEPLSWYQEHPARSLQIVQALLARRHGRLLPTDVVMGAGVAPSVAAAAKADTGVWGNPASAATKGKFPNLPRPPAPPLTPAQQLALGLALNPDSPTLRDQQIAEDRATLAWLQRRRASGKLSNAEYVAQATPLLSQIASDTTKATTGTNKAAAAANKAMAAHAKAVTATAEHFRNMLAAAKPTGTLTVSTGLTKRQIDDYDVLVAFYKAEAHDSELTAEARQRYAGLAISARQAEARLEATEATQYGNETSKALRNRVAAATDALKATRATLTPTEIKSYDRLVAFYQAEAHNSALTATQRQTYAGLAIAAKATEARASVKAATGYAAATAQSLKDTAANVSGTVAITKTGLTPAEVSAYDQLIAFYVREQHDSRLTADLRARYQGYAIAARTREKTLAGRGATDYEKIRIDAARAAAENAEAASGRVSIAHEAAISREIAVYVAASKNMAVPATTRAGYATDAATQRATLAGLRNTLALPLPLQLAAARAGAADFGQTSPADISVALRTKAYDERLLKAHALSIEGQIAVYNNIAQQNQILGAQAIAGNFTVMSAVKLATALGLTGAAKQQGEDLIAQVLAHGGHVPTGLGSQGAMVHGHGITIGELHLHGVHDVDSMVAEIQKRKQHIPVQNSGPNAGRTYP